MPCYHPIPARTNHKWKAGQIVQARPTLYPDTDANLQLPCGKCLGCLTDRAQDWAHRAMHEASQHEHNIFVTLTYNEESLPRDEQLEPEELQRFLKRLRRATARKRKTETAIRSTPPHRLRYIAAGEYGERGGRPHYHLLLFNITFTDFHEVGTGLYESPTLSRIWPYGHNRCGVVTEASAAYTAQYTLKKQSEIFVTPDGVVKTKPFMRMSLKPLIGSQWLEKYRNDLQHGYLVTTQGKTRIPRTYRTKLATLEPELHNKIRQSLDNYREAAPHDQDLEAAERIHKRRKELTENRKL
ncbi:MAG: replication initiator protein [Microvirus sp.]|nr:MAG: replication initiator protein [Microvirus sp.]